MRLKGAVVDLGIQGDNIIEKGIKGEKVIHPIHYNKGKFEVIDVIEDWKLNFHEGNAIKYIGRARHKGNYQQDIKKAIWYLERMLEDK